MCYAGSIDMDVFVGVRCEEEGVAPTSPTSCQPHPQSLD